MTMIQLKIFHKIDQMPISIYTYISITHISMLESLSVSSDNCFVMSKNPDLRWQNIDLSLYCLRRFLLSLSKCNGYFHLPGRGCFSRYMMFC